MSEPFMGQIIQGGWSYAPRGYAFCQGQLQSIQQNNALFALLGTTYGGDGQNTFGLPNLAGRSMVGSGQLQGGGTYVLGETAGTETNTLTMTNLPAHTHTLTASTVKATTQGPTAGASLGVGIDLDTTVNGNPAIYTPAGTANNTVLSPASIGATGNNVPINNLSPFQVVTMVIALQGIFPSRN